MNEPQDGEEFVKCCECHKTVSKDDAEPVIIIATNKPAWMCDKCVAEEEFDQRSLDLFDA